MVKKIVNEIMETCNEENPFFKKNAEIICTYLIQYIEFEYGESAEELKLEIIVNELKGIDKLIFEEQLPVKIFLLVAQTYSKRMKIIGNDEDVLDFSFVLDQSENVVQSSYLVISKVLENKKTRKEFVSVATLGFMNSQVKELSEKYKFRIQKEREDTILKND